jgi:predicted  nucleic acid-binding Zn-ribbon protein
MSDVPQAALLRLLDLQTEDTQIKQLEDRRANLAEATRLEEVNADMAELTSDLAIAEKQFDEVARAQARLEDQIELIDRKVSKEEQRMFSGSVSNPKELGALQAEVASLKRRKETIEDELIEVMDQREQAEGTRDRLKGELADATKVATELGATVTGLTADIDAELATHRAERTKVTAEMPDDLLALYEKIRPAKSGVGAAALAAGTCQGCHTKLPSAEYERVRAEGGLQRCDNCRRILVVV